MQRHIIFTVLTALLSVGLVCAEPKKTFSSGRSTYTQKTYSSSGKTKDIKPGKTSFDSIGAKEQMKAESRQLYQKSQTAKSEYKVNNSTIKIDPKDQKIDRLRSQLSHERWVNRDLRQQQFYGSYLNRPLVVYHDPYPSFFWWWLLDRSLEERALWAYHHRYDMDSARYQTLLSKDSQMETRIKALEAQNLKRDESYTPKGMDTDLMYSNNYIDAVYNPTTEDSYLSAILLLAIIVLLLYLVFRKRK